MKIMDLENSNLISPTNAFPMIMYLPFVSFWVGSRYQLWFSGCSWKNYGKLYHRILRICTQVRQYRKLICVNLITAVLTWYLLRPNQLYNRKMLICRLYSYSWICFFFLTSIVRAISNSKSKPDFVDQVLPKLFFYCRISHYYDNIH